MGQGGSAGGEAAWLLWLIPAFPFLFVAFWCFVVAVIARLGWARLAERYATHVTPPPTAQRLGGQSLSIGTGLTAPSYRNCVTAWIDTDGLFLRPMILFRPFHPMLRLRWSEIARVEDAPLLFLRRRIRVSPIGDVPPLLLVGRLASTVEDIWRRRHPTPFVPKG